MCIHGVAGAGKSTLVKALNDAAGEGTTLIALAPTSSAAANLGITAGIESRTVASLVASGGLVTGQNYYTAITRARFGVKLWTEDQKRLADKLSCRTGEKTSALEGLGRLERDSHRAREERHGERWDRLRQEQREAREERRARMRERSQPLPKGPLERFADHLASRAQRVAESFDRYFEQVLAPGQEGPSVHGDAPHTVNNQPAHTDHAAGQDH